MKGQPWTCHSSSPGSSRSSADLKVESAGRPARVRKPTLLRHRGRWSDQLLASVSKPFEVFRFRLIMQSGPMSAEALTGQQVAAAGLSGWVFLLHYGLHGLETRIQTADFVESMRIAQEIGEAAVDLHHHADIHLRRTQVDVRLTSGYDVGGVTETDVILARRISAIAESAGARIDPSGVSRLELALDTPDQASVAPFWAAVLDRELVVVDGWADVGDRGQVNPLIWFQPSDGEETRQRWHLDVWVPPDQVPRRIEAALAAGGRLIRADSGAHETGEDGKTGAQLSDPDGNRVCLATWEGRA